MATDHDAPRPTQAEDQHENSIQNLTGRRADTQSGSVDADDPTAAESAQPRAADLSITSDDEFTERVVPEQADEFTCPSCFLVHHRSRLVRRRGGDLVCRDCA